MKATYEIAWKLNELDLRLTGTVIGMKIRFAGY